MLHVALFNGNGCFQGSTVVQANYCGMSFTADVLVDVAEINCELLVGCEWMTLRHLVLEDLSVPRGGFGDIPSSCEKSLQLLSPVNRGVTTASLVNCDIASGSISSNDAQRHDFIIKVLQSMECPPVACDPDINILQVYYALHGIVVSQGGHYAGVSLWYLFTGMCAVREINNKHLA